MTITDRHVDIVFIFMATLAAFLAGTTGVLLVAFVYCVGERAGERDG